MIVFGITYVVSVFLVAYITGRLGLRWDDDFLVGPGLVLTVLGPVGLLFAAAYAVR